MPKIVMKFGGTSVADLDRIRNVARLVKKQRDAGDEVAVVVSAMSGTTNHLVKLCNDLNPLHDTAEYDAVVATGEQVTTGLLAIALQSLGTPARSWQGWQIPILSDDAHSKARVDSIDGQKLLAAMARGETPIIAGFQGVSADGRVTTLGRGGSDLSAVAIAAAIKADRCDIYTDVDGIYTTDPRMLPKARRLASISYDEMLELASLGAGVMHSRSIEFAKKFGVKVLVRSSFKDMPGTVILAAEQSTPRPASGVALAKDEARITLENVPDQPGSSHALFSKLAASGIELPAAYAAKVRVLENFSPKTINDASAIGEWFEMFTAFPLKRTPGWRAQMTVVPRENRLLAYRSISTEVLVIGFADDVITPPALGREVGEALPNGRYIQIANAGHLGFLERPDPVNNAMLQFFAGTLI